MPPRRHRPRQVLQAAILSLQLDRRLGDEAEVDVAGGESRVRRDEASAQPRHDASVLRSPSLSGARCDMCGQHSRAENVQGANSTRSRMSQQEGRTF